MNERYHAKIKRPELESDYNENMITERYQNYGWKYFWNPRSSKILALINNITESSIRIGVEYDLEDLSNILRTSILTQIYSNTPEVNEQDLINKLSILFQLQSEEIDIRDRRTLLWPILQNTYCLSFEEIYNSKYPVKNETVQFMQVTNKKVNVSKTMDKKTTVMENLPQHPILQEHASEVVASYPNTSDNTYSLRPVLNVHIDKPMEWDSLDISKVQLNFIIDDEQEMKRSDGN